jgi:hypothetical protein
MTQRQSRCSAGTSIRVRPLRGVSHEEADNEGGGADGEHAGGIEEEIAAEVAHPDVHGDGNKEVQDQTSGCQDAENRNPDAGHQPSRGGELDHRHQRPVPAWEAHVPEALGDEPGRLQAENTVDGADGGEDEDRPGRSG